MVPIYRSIDELRLLYPASAQPETEYADRQMAPMDHAGESTGEERDRG